jgi:glycosyltransferase involved in cell wall biosynthesis
MTVALKVVIGIASADRRQQLGLTLAQLRKQRTLPDRIVVCPKGADDYDERSAAAFPCPVDVVRGAAGLCAQRNAILRTCRSADILIFLDDDFYPASDYVERVVELFLQHSEIVIATHHPLLDGASGPGISHERALSALEALERSPPSAKGTRAIGGAYGCNMALRLATVFDNELWFDENLPLYGWLEDLDFSHRLARHGRVVECALLRGVHLGTKRGRSSGIRLGYSQIANPIYMLRKGSLSPAHAFKQMAKNVAKNSLRALKPEPWVDRRGRLKGNALAVGDLLRGQLHPQKAARL